MSKVVLLSIDPQYDFCSPDGALSVPGADKDMERLAAMVGRCKKDIDDIIVTLDSHRTLHIAHPIWWSDKDGNHPAPFTLINEEDVTGSDPKWTATNPGFRSRSIEYVQELKKNNRYVLCVWPPHCLIGSRGTMVQPVLFDALCAWEAQFAAVNYVTKGSYMFTEHYSAVKADVFAPEEPSTGLNNKIIKIVADPEVSMILISGEASSHCVAHTVKDIVSEFGEENIKKFVFLEDTSSPVPGFEKQAEDFINDMSSRGMKIDRSDNILS